MEKIDIRGLKFANVTMDEAIWETKKILKKAGIHTIYTPNAEIAYKASHDKKFENILNSADLLLPDGAGCIKASKILKKPLKQKVAGVEYGKCLAKMCAENNYSLYLLGGKSGVAEKAAENLVSEFPDLVVAGTHDGYFSKSDNSSEQIIQTINDSKADIVFVCLGAPTQEYWTFANKEKFAHAKLIVCLGGSLDVYSGLSQRAPDFFIKANCEWLYRLIREPRRFKRMLVLPKYIAETRKFSKK